MGDYSFEIVDISKLNQQEYNDFIDKSVYTTLEWLRFLNDEAKTTTIIIKINQGDRFIGYFTGASIKKFGVKIFGAPFPGWSTCHMAIDTNEDIDRCEIIKQIVPFIYRNTKCVYIEIIDRHITMEMAKKYGFKANPVGTLLLDVDKTDEELFKQMKTDCRNFIRQFERRGARIEIAEPNDEFAEEFYKQLEDVFAKQGLVPTHNIDTIKRVVNHLNGTGKILCLKVLSPDDRCIASSIYLGFGETFYYWAGASYRPDQHFRPNEYMIWTAIKYWRDHGCKLFDMMGIRDYKRKFGSYEYYCANLIFTEYPFLISMKDIAGRIYYKMGAVKGKILRRK